MTAAPAEPARTRLTLVTGGSGYFGSLLLARLASAGVPVRNFDLVPMDEPVPGVEFMQGDVRDLKRMREACRGVEVVHHCVGQVPLARNRELFETVNVAGTENLVRAAHEAGARKVVMVSTSAVFGIPRRNPVVETDEPHPAEIYGRTKLEGELVARKFAKESGLDLTILRPPTIVGHGRLGIFELLFDWIADGRSVYVLGGGRNIYQFLHAEDLAEACILAAARPGGPVYHIGSDEPCSMRDSLEGLVRHAGTGSRVRSIPKAPAMAAMATLTKLGLAPFADYIRLLYGHDMFFDSSLAKRELGWRPRWNNIAMMIQSYDWYLVHREEVKRSSGASTHRSPVKQGVMRLLKWFG